MSDADFDMEDLLDQVDQEAVLAESWSHEEGDILAGRVVGKEERPTDFPESGRETYFIIVVECAKGSTENGGKAIKAGETRSILAGSTVLHDKLGRAEFGDAVAVKDLGKAKSKAGREYQNFNVVIRPGN